MAKEEMTIEELERELEQSFTVPSALRAFIPAGFRPRVTLYGPGQKKRKNASAKKWSPESDEIRIYFERDETAASNQPEAKRPEPPAVEPGSSLPARPAPGPLTDLIRALDRAESRPRFDFVALKWFRDVALLEEGFAWVQSESARHNALRDAIERRLILTSRVPNPRSPQFPVTSIRLNRLLPEVQAILGTSGLGGEDFKPVAIRGESLSATVLRERR